MCRESSKKGSLLHVFKDKIKKLKKMPVLVTSNLLKLYPTTVII